MRAVASNRDSARLAGIRTGTMLMTSWGIASALGAVGGTLVAGNQRATSTLGLMFTVFFYASAAATLGGFDSLGGAVIAGLSIGVLENMVAGYQPDWIGQELTPRRGADRHLRRAAVQAVGPVRLPAGGTGVAVMGTPTC